MENETGKAKVVGFNIIEEECIWAKAGIVNFKRCSNAYDCNTCKFDKAMFAATQPGREDRKPGLGETLARRSSTDRQCRHMLTGRVDFKLCDNSYKCESCEYDQMLDYSDDMNPTGIVPEVDILGYAYADNYYYRNGHTWARVEYGGRVRIGMDDFARRLLGRPDSLELPEIGKRLSRSDRIAAIMRLGNHADLPSPVSGTVIAVNRDALKTPGLVHSDPFGKGWLALVDPRGLEKSLRPLHFGPEGKAWLISEAHRLEELVMGGYGPMAATGAPPVDDVFAAVPEIGWKTLVDAFIRV